jgi:hypothetical protein
MYLYVLYENKNEEMDVKNVEWLILIQTVEVKK